MGGVNLKLTQLEYILTVSECGSITAATEKLFVTQPTLSQQIMKLEEELGVQLFVRQSRNMVTTLAGEEFLVYARRILNDLDCLTNAMTDYSMHNKGKIRIGMFSSFGASSILNRLFLFSRENPMIETLITVNEGKTLLNMLTAHHLDAAFIPFYGNPPDIQGIYMTKMYDTNMFVLLSPDHPLREKCCIDYTDMKDENIIMPLITSNLHSILVAGFSNSNVNPKIICETCHPEIMVQMVVGKMGVAFGSEVLVQANIYNGIMYRPLKRVITQTIYFAMPMDACEIPANRKFLNFISG